jgi:hypothetical protein
MKKVHLLLICLLISLPVFACDLSQPDVVCFSGDDPFAAGELWGMT